MNEDLTFEYGAGIQVSYGCAATLKNEFWYFGGCCSNKRQVYCKKYSFDMYWFFFRQVKLLDASWNVRQT